MRLYSDEELARLLDKEIFHQISDAADRVGVECYVVGGYVRDLFLERPSDDIDVVVVGSGIDVAKELKRRLGRKAHLSVFKNFGTAQVKAGDLEVEFVGARKESYSHDSRKPVVENGTLEDDQNRRDFTINAMAICLNKDRFGQLVDPFNGLADLEDGIVATPLEPDITFSDDPLRMMRCIRFATQLNFQIEDETFAALERMADRIKIVSGERISVELNKIIMARHPSIGFEYLQRSGLLNIILPELAALDIVEKKNGRAHKNNFYHTLEVLENVVKSEKSRMQEAGLYLRWAALLHDIGKTKTKRWEPAVGWTFHNHNFVGAKMVATVFRRLKLPLGAEMKYVQKLVDLHMRPQVIADSEVTDSAVRRLLNDAGEDIDDLMTLCEADITSKNEARKKMFLENFRMVREKLTDLKEKDYVRLLQPVIDGNEIMQMFNLKPSREVGLLKQYLKDAVLDNRVENEREPLMQLLVEKARQMGLKAVLLLSLLMMAVGSAQAVEKTMAAKTDSLRHEITVKSGKQKSKAYKELYRAYYNMGETQKALDCLNDWIAYEDDLGDLEDEGRARWCRLVLLSNFGLTHELEEEAPVQMAWFESQKQWVNFYNAWDCKAESYYYQGKLQTALREAQLMLDDAHTRTRPLAATCACSWTN